MVTKRSCWERVFDVINVLALGILTLVFLYPMWYVVMAAFSEPAKFVSHTGLLWIPEGFSLDGFQMVLRTASITTGYINTIFYVVVGTVLNILLTSMGAYVLSRRKLYIRRFLSLAIVFTMYLSGGLIPFYLTVRGLGLYNTRWALLLPVTINTWNLIVMRTSMAQIPESLEEAAKMDGANDFIILFRIILPVIKSTLAVMVLFYAVQHWNAWFHAMIFLQDRSKYPLQLFLREILLSGSMTDISAGATGEDVNNILTMNMLKYCTIVVSTLPILCIYPFLQKYFAKGVMIGSVKE